VSTRLGNQPGGILYRSTSLVNGFADLEDQKFSCYYIKDGRDRRGLKLMIPARIWRRFCFIFIFPCYRFYSPFLRCDAKQLLGPSNDFLLFLTCAFLFPVQTKSRIHVSRCLARCLVSFSFLSVVQTKNRLVTGVFGGFLLLMVFFVMGIYF